MLPHPSGELLPAAGKRAVLIAACHMTLEGVVLVKPVVPSEQNHDILARAEAAVSARLEVFFRTGPLPGDDTPGPGR